GQGTARLPDTGREMVARTRASRCYQPGATGMNNLPVLRTDLDSRPERARGHGLIWTGPDACTGIYGSDDHRQLGGGSGRLSRTGRRGGWGGGPRCRLVAGGGWVLVDAREGELPAGSAEPLALRRVPELGAFRADVLGYLAVLFQVSHLRGDGAEVGVEPVGYRFLHVESHDGAVSLFDVVLYGV